MSEALGIARILQIEAFTAPGGIQDLAGQRGLARLPWPEQGNHGTEPEQRSDPGRELGTRYEFHVLEIL
jgi:hypothetical protein